MKLVKAMFEEDSYELYNKYNSVVHSVDINSKQSYIDFLCLQALSDEYIINENGEKLVIYLYYLFIK